MHRIPQLDGFRGLLIIIITINHASIPFIHFLYQPFGYTSAAEGFVFLSGIVASLAYQKRLDRSGFADMQMHAFLRTRTIYLYHLAVLLLICAIVYFSAIHGTYWKNVFQGLQTHPVQVVLLSTLLLYQPNFHDILPLYCILFLFLPWLIQQFRQNHTKRIFVISIVLWILSQAGMGISYKLRDFLSPYLSAIALSKTDIFGWQLLFVIGVYIGHRRYEGKPIEPPVALVWACIPLILFMTLCRHSEQETSNWLFERLIDKSRLGPLRLVNFASLVLVITYLMKKIPSLFHQSWLVVIGKHSLQIFALHIILIFLLAPLVAEYTQHVPGAIVYILFLIGILYVVALWLEKRVLRQKQAPHT